MKEMINKKRRVKVLFFDDEVFISKTLTNTLILIGWDVTLVSEIDSLFEKLDKKRYDILILDIMAPIPNMKNKVITFKNKEIEEMNGGINTGVVIAKKIWHRKPDLPILFLSARRLDTILQLPRNRRFDYIRKPVLVDDLDIKLKELL